MPDNLFPRSSRLSRIAAVLTVSVVLAGCGSADAPGGGDDAGATSVTGDTSTSPETPTTVAGADSTSPGSSPTSASGGKSPRLPRSVQDAYERFGTLAPRSLFEKFDSCMPNGVADSSACSGEEVGQFQFFANEAKAASTTQLLTELRSARIVQDDGDVIVGWSTVGTVAIITVVDNANGVVLQQMVSTDEQDPRERIVELGLARNTATSSRQPLSGGSSPVSTPRSSSSPSVTTSQTTQTTRSSQQGTSSSTDATTGDGSTGATTPTGSSDAPSDRVSD
ncbi:hypothetical protein [Corynebacterium pygosceleis]|uniref:hypothetical protein n=1 Tax=Corynebacterium pygosceleis TaxID=2800406 RepID=UPI001903D967|nr:hypothetical protein [Corynebacterium pygosceleis]